MPRRRLSPTPREMALAYEYEYTPAFAKWQRLLSPEQYEIAEVRTLVASVGRCCSRRPLYRPSGRPSPPSLILTASSESLSRQGSDGGDSWPGKRLPSRNTW